MANIAQPQVVINYISQLKKITVNRNNQPSQLIIQTDYNLNETYNFQVINKINQIVELDTNTTYQLYGTYIDAKKQVHILFYTLGVTPRDNILSFLVNTYTSEYLAYVKNNRTPIDISIVAKQNVGGSTRSYMVLRDCALANPRGYVEGQAPTDIVYQTVFNSQIPVSTAFGAGNNLNLVQDLEGQEIYSFAFGDSLSTNNANQFVIGYNNTPDATKAFIVANSGNIFTVDYEGNVEAGDLNVGAISATSITVSGEDLNQVIDDKVEYLSTTFDDKFTATSAWVSDTFETIANVAAKESALNDKIDALSTASDNKFELKTDATSKYNTLISQISDLNTATNNEFTATSGWANGKFETITNVATKETALNNRIDALSNATDLKFTSTSGWANDTFETKTNASQKYGQLSAAIHAVTTGGIAELTQNVAAISGDLETVSGAVQTNADNIATISNELDGVEQDVDNISGDVIANKGLIDEVSGIATINQTNIGTLSTDLGTLSGEVQTNTENISTISGKLDDYATIDELSAISGALDEAIGLVDTKADTNKGLIDAVSGDLDTAEANIEYISGFVSGLPTDISTKAAQTDVEYISSFVSGLPSAIDLKAEQTDVDYISGFVSGLPTEIATKADQDEFEAISGKAIANENAIGEINTYLESIPTTYATIDTLSTVSGALADDIDSLSTKVGQIEGGLDNYATTDQVEQISSFVSGLPDQISTKANQTDLDYVSSFVSGLPEDISTKAAQTDVDYISSFVSGLPTDIAAKANQTDLDAVSSFVSGLPEDIAAKADSSALEDYALKTDISDFITAEDIPTYTGVSGIGITLVDDVYEVAITGEVGKTYTAGTGIGLDETNGKHEFYLTGTVLTGGDHISIENNVVSLVGDVGKTYSGTETGGIEVDNTNNTITLSATIPTTVAELSDSSDYVQQSEITSFVTEQEVEDAISGKADKSELNGLASEDYVTGYCSAFITVDDIPTSYVQQSDLDDYAKIEDVPTDEEISGIVEGYNYQNASQVSGIASAVVEDLSTTIRSGLASTSDIPTTVAELTDSGDYALKSELIDTEDVSGVVEAMSATIIDGLATEGFVTGQGYITNAALDDYALKTDLPSDYTTSAQVSSIVNTAISEIPGATEYDAGTGLERVLNGNKFLFNLTGTILTGGTNIEVTGKSINFTGTIPTTVAELSDHADYALVSQLPSDFTTSAQVSSIVTGYGYAKASDIPTTVAELTDSSDYAKVADLTAYIEKSASGAFATSGQMTELSTQVQGLPTTSDIPTDDEITGLAKDYVDTLNIATTYATKDELSSKANSADVYSKTVADQTFATKTDISDMATQTWVGQQGFATTSQLPSDYTTSAQVSSIVEGYGYITGYNEGTGIKIDNGEVSLTAAIPSKISDLTNDSQFATSAQVSSIVEGYNFIMEGELSAVGQLINDVGYITGYQAGDGITITNGVIAATGGGGGTTSYTAGTGINIANDTISVKLSAGSNIDLSIDANGYVVISGTPEGSIDVDTLCGMLSSADTNTLTISKSGDYVVLSAAGGGEGTTYQAGSGLALSTDNTFVLTANIPTVPTNVGDFTNDVGYLTAVPDTYALSEDVTSEIATATGVVTSWVNSQGYVKTDTTYSAGTGITIDTSNNNAININLSADANSNVVVSADNNGVVWLSSTPQGGGGGGSYTAGPGIAINNGVISCTIDNTLDLVNGNHFITTNSITTKQRVYTCPTGNLTFGAGTQIVYYPTFEIFKTTYLTEAGYTPILFMQLVDDNNSISEGEVATFEEWMYISGVDVPSADFQVNATLIGELPETIEAGKTHVFVHRLVGDGGTVTEYVSYAYSFGGDNQ